MILATFIWGLGFVGARWTLTEYSPVWSNSLRFAVAGAISIPIFLFQLLMTRYRNRRTDNNTTVSPDAIIPDNGKIAGTDILINPGIICCSIILASAMQVQTAGIALTSLAKSGFLTVFYAIFTPIILAFAGGARLNAKYWLMVVSAIFGMAMLCNFQLDNFNTGDVYILVSALLFSFHIIAVDRCCRGRNPLLFNMAQCFYIGCITVTGALILEGPPDLRPLIQFDGLFQPSPLNGLIIMAVFSSVLAFSLQIRAQQSIKPHIVSMIFLLESIFAAIFGYLFFAEMLSPMAIAGCVTVLLAVAGVLLQSNRPASLAIREETGFESAELSVDTADKNLQIAPVLCAPCEPVYSVSMNAGGYNGRKGGRI